LSDDMIQMIKRRYPDRVFLE